MTIARFKSGRVVATPGAEALLAQIGTDVFELLAKHLSGDFGELDTEDTLVQNVALVREAKNPDWAERIFSVWTIDENKLWIITEADRSVTTFLLPSEY